MNQENSFRHILYMFDQLLCIFEIEVRYIRKKRTSEEGFPIEKLLEFLSNVRGENTSRFVNPVLNNLPCSKSPLLSEGSRCSRNRSLLFSLKRPLRSSQSVLRQTSCLSISPERTSGERNSTELLYRWRDLYHSHYTAFTGLHSQIWNHVRWFPQN